MPTLVLFSGPPGSGKSTQSAFWKKKLDDPIYISTDDLVERYARYTGKTYSEVFNYVAPRSLKRLKKLVKKAIAEQRNVIWDQTSLTEKIRKERAELFEGYHKVLLCVKAPLDIEELKRRNDTRPRGRMSWFKIVGPMVKSYQYPTLEEKLSIWSEVHEF